MTQSAPWFRSASAASAAISAPASPAAGAVQRLAAGAVVRVTERRARWLRIDSGCAWLTFACGAVDAEGVRAGDVFLCAGQTLRIPVGARVLMEAACGMELRFAWQPSEAGQRTALSPMPCGTGAGVEAAN